MFSKVLSRRPYLGKLTRHRLAAERAIVAILWLHGPVLGLIGWLSGEHLRLGLALWAAIALVATGAHRIGSGQARTRATLAAALCIMPALMIMEMTGKAWQADAHMLFFVEVAVTAAMLDRRAVLVGGLVATLHHIAVNFVIAALVLPEGANLSRVAFHALVIVFECGVLMWLVGQWAAAIREAQAAVVETAELAMLGAAEHDRAKKMALARDAAEAAARAKSEFLATMSHEIRSPMSGLVGVLEVLREAQLDTEPHRMANMAHSSALVLLAVLNDILDFSKIEAGALSIVPEPVLLRKLVDDLVQPHMLQTARKGVALTVCWDAEIAECVAVDPLRLRQVLNNLLSNAIKFTASGEILLSVGITMEEMAPRLRFTVRDTGIGMSPEVTSRLFEPFMQADGSTTRDFGGTGLGLCICQRLAGLLDGTLTVTSRAGEGSEFTLSLPLVTARMPDIAALNDTLLASRCLGVGRNALVVDDDATIRWLSQRQLEQLGMAVDVAENGEAALAMLLVGRYDLLLTDCHMPRMDGVALTRAVRAASDPLLRGMLIIGLTADVTDAQRARCQAAGMTDVATKPLSRTQLAILLSSLLGRHLDDEVSAAASVPAAATGGPAGLAVFDPASYRDIFAPGDPEGAVWLAEYLEIGASVVDEMEQLCATAEDAAIACGAVAAIAHRFAGTSLSVGATRLGEAARVLEHVAQGDDLATLRAQEERVRIEFSTARRAIAAFLAEMRQDATADQPTM